MFSTSPESPPLFIVDPTILSLQLHRNNNLCVSGRHDPRTEVARRPIWAEVARIRPARIWHWRNGLTAGGNWTQTIGPALVKGLAAVADERCRTDKLDGVIKHRWSRETTMSAAGPLSTAISFSAGPMVRIRFPPAASQTNSRPNR